MQAGGPPSEDELVAIAAAVDAYIAIDYQLHMQQQRADKSLSPWLVASRLQSTASAQPLKRGTKTSWRDRQKTSLWGNLFSFALAASALSISLAPQAVAQGKSLVAAGNAASYCGTWNYNDNGLTVRVLLGAPRQKVDLDLPDGGSIYSSGGTLVARIGPRSSWSLNLASSAAGNFNSPNRLALTASPPGECADQNLFLRARAHLIPPPLPVFPARRKTVPVNIFPIGAGLSSGPVLSPVERPWRAALPWAARPDI